MMSACLYHDITRLYTMYVDAGCFEGECLRMQRKPRQLTWHEHC